MAKVSYFRTFIFCVFSGIIRPLRPKKKNCHQIRWHTAATPGNRNKVRRYTTPGRIGPLVRVAQMEDDGTEKQAQAGGNARHGQKTNSGMATGGRRLLGDGGHLDGGVDEGGSRSDR